MGLKERLASRNFTHVMAARNIARNDYPDSARVALSVARKPRTLGKYPEQSFQRNRCWD
jgi:hypothetical protein